MKRSLSALSSIALLLGVPTCMADTAAQAASAAAAPAASSELRDCRSGDRIQELFVECQDATIQITVRTNPTTGFDWHIRNFDPARVAPGDSRYQPLSKDPTLAGAPSTGIYTAKLLQGGETGFDLWYMRNWKGGEVAYGYRFTVILDDSGRITGYHLTKLSHLDWKEEYRN